MALTLKEAITATQTTVDVNGTDALSNGDLYAIEDEQVFITTAEEGSIQPGETAWQRLTVQRGALGTTEVGHAAGTSMTSVETPLGVGGSQVYVSAEDPGAVGARNLWMATAGTYPQWWVRSAANDAWESAGPPGWADETRALISSPAAHAELTLVDDNEGSDPTRLIAETIELESTIGANKRLRLDEAGFHIGNASAPVLLSGAADPTVAPVEAVDGSVYLRTDGSLWLMVSGDWELLGTQAANVPELDLTVTDPPTQAEVQSVADTLDALIAALVASNLMAAS